MRGRERGREEGGRGKKEKGRSKNERASIVGTMLVTLTMIGVGVGPHNSQTLTLWESGKA